MIKVLIKLCAYIDSFKVLIILVLRNGTSSILAKKISLFFWENSTSTAQKVY